MEIIITVRTQTVNVVWIHKVNRRKHVTPKNITISTGFGEQETTTMKKVEGMTDMKTRGTEYMRYDREKMKLGTKKQPRS